MKISGKPTRQYRQEVDTGGSGRGANKVTGYPTDLMAILQEILKASSGIDVLKRRFFLLFFL